MDKVEVERRREPRYESRQPARIRTLSGAQEVLDGILVNVSGRGAKLAVEKAFPINTLVRIDVGDTLLLGDVCYCRKESDGYSLGIALSHSVLEITAMGNLMNRLLPARQHETQNHRTPGDSVPH